MIRQHWFRSWFGAVKQQVITWANVDPVFCCHMATLGLNELKTLFIQIVSVKWHNLCIFGETFPVSLKGFHWTIVSFSQLFFPYLLYMFLGVPEQLLLSKKKKVLEEALIFVKNKMVWQCLYFFMTVLKNLTQYLLSNSIGQPLLENHEGHIFISHLAIYLKYNYIVEITIKFP